MGSSSLPAWAGALLCLVSEDLLAFHWPSHWGAARMVARWRGWEPDGEAGRGPDSRASPRQSHRNPTSWNCFHPLFSARNLQPATLNSSNSELLSVSQLKLAFSFHRTLAGGSLLPEIVCLSHSPISWPTSASCFILKVTFYFWTWWLCLLS